MRDWIDAMLWIAGSLLGFGGLVVLTYIFLDAPRARYDLARGDELLPDLITKQAHNANYWRKREQIATCAILAIGGFVILGIQILAD